MTQSLNRVQAIILGLVITIALGLVFTGMAAIGRKQGLWSDTTEITVQFPEVHGITPGTPVRIRGMEVGYVSSIDYPTLDGPLAAVTLRMKVDSKYSSRIYADALAQVHSIGLLGSNVIAIQPGSPTSGPLVEGRLSAKATRDLYHEAAKLGAAADEVSALVRDARHGNGTLSRLLHDESLYSEITGLTKDSRAVVKRASDAVDVAEKKADEVDQFVKDGRVTLRSFKQGADAVQSLPIIRDYVVDAKKILLRSDCVRDDVTYLITDLFEPNTAILTEDGKQHLLSVANWVRSVKNPKAEIVIVAQGDSTAKEISPDEAYEQSRKQAEVVTDFLKANKAFKVGWFSSRKATALGLGQSPSPVGVQKDPTTSLLQVIVFTPQ